MKKVLIALEIVWFIVSSVTGTPVAGQVDDFQDGTTQGWRSGLPNPNPPSNAANVGPLGEGDHSLLVKSSGGIGPGSKLVTYNISQWQGNYTEAGLTAIEMDLNNIGDTDLMLRLMLAGAGGDFSSTDGFMLAAGSGWQTASFGVTAADLTSVGGIDIDRTLASVNEFRLLHSLVPDLRGDEIVATLLVDNITAIAPPDCLMRASFGDFNCDANVNLTDLVTLGENYNSTGLDPGVSFMLGDTNADGDVNLTDLVTVGENFNTVISPEPGGMVLVMVGGLLLGRRRG